MALLNLGLLIYYSPTLTVVALLVAAFSCGITIGSGLMILRYNRQILELKGRFFGLLVQLINGVAKLRVAAAEERGESSRGRVQTPMNSQGWQRSIWRPARSYGSTRAGHPATEPC